METSEQSDKAAWKSSSFSIKLWGMAKTVLIHLVHLPWLPRRNFSRMLKLCKAISRNSGIARRAEQPDKYEIIPCPVLRGSGCSALQKRLLDRSLRIDGQRGMESCFWYDEETYSVYSGIPPAPPKAHKEDLEEIIGEDLGEIIGFRKPKRNI
jgi:hypothetical protein